MMSGCSSCSIYSDRHLDIQSIPAEDILHVKVECLKYSDSFNCIGRQPRTHRVVVHFATPGGKPHELHMDTCRFDGTLAECENLASDLSNKRHGHWMGPPNEKQRKFLVFINPIAGHKKGYHIYHSTVEPLLKACGITCDVIVSSKKGDIEHEIQTRDLEGYCGVLSIGGEGTMNEAVKGLLLRAMKEGGRDINDINCTLAHTSIPIGIIPTGGGNWLCHDIQGTCDVTTAVIHVIKGHTVPMSTMTIHEPGRLLCMSMLVVHLGFLGDMIHKVEMNRWLGPARYKVIPHITLLNRRLMPVDITLHPTHEDRPWSIDSLPPQLHPLFPFHEEDHSEVDSCIHSSEANRERNCPSMSEIQPGIQKEEEREERHHASNKPGTWPTKGAGENGKGTGLPSSTNLLPEVPVSGCSSLVDPLEPFVDETHAQITDGHIQTDAYNICMMVTHHKGPGGRLDVRLGGDTVPLLVIKKCSIPDFVKHLVKFRDSQKGVADFDFVESREVTAIKVDLTTKESLAQSWYMNVDGECIDMKASTGYFRLHPQVFRVFGPPQPAEVPVPEG